MKILYGTTNKAKLQAMRTALESFDIELIGLADIDSELPSINENGKTPLGPDLIVTICNFFHCSTDYLYFGREKETMSGNDMIQKITMLLPNTPEEGVKVVLDMLLVLNKD